MITAAFIAARMTSTRFPGKVLQPLGNMPVLQHLVNCCRRTGLVHEVFVLTGASAENDPIRAFCESINVRCISGHDTDVLTRFYEGFQPLRFRYTHILRLTADCPFHDPALLDRLMLLTNAASADYGVIVTGDSPVEGHRYPNGYDAEVLSSRALSHAHVATFGDAREHVTRELWKNGQCDAVPSYKMWHPSEDLGKYSVTLDTMEDYARLQRLWEWHGGEEPNFNSTLAWLKQEVR